MPADHRTIAFVRVVRLGYRGAGLGVPLGITTFFLMLTWDGLRRDPSLLSSALTTPSNPEIRLAIWSLSVPSLLISLSGRIGLLSDDLVAGGFLGPAMAFSLYVTARLPSLAQVQLQAIGAASWAGLAELHAQRAYDTFNRRLVELTTLVAVLGIAGLGPIAAYGRPFFLLWMRGKTVTFGGEAVVIIASVNAFLLGLFSLWGWCFAGTGQVRRLVVPAVVATVGQPGGQLAPDAVAGAGRPGAGNLGGQLDDQPLVAAASTPQHFWHFPACPVQSGGLALGVGRALCRNALVGGSHAPAMGLARSDRRDGSGRSGISGREWDSHSEPNRSRPVAPAVAGPVAVHAK